MLKNTCRRISEDARILRFFRHRGPLRQFHFLQILSKSILLFEIHSFGVLRSIEWLRILVGTFRKIEEF